MKDPTQWSSQDMSELERRLLEAARGDQVPDALQLRMSEALASLPPTAAAAGAGSLFSSAGIWGSLSVVIVAGVVGWQLQTAPAREAPRSLAPAVVAPPAAPAVASLPVVVVPQVEPQPTAAPPKLLGAPSRPARSLREELALLDEARAALSQSAAERAAKLLDQHARQFPRPSLGPESEALRIEVLVAQGQTQRASRLAQRFIDRHPNHPLAVRIASAL